MSEPTCSDCKYFRDVVSPFYGVKLGSCGFKPGDIEWVRPDSWCSGFQPKPLPPDPAPRRASPVITEKDFAEHFKASVKKYADAAKGTKSDRNK